MSEQGVVVARLLDAQESCAICGDRLQEVAEYGDDGERDRAHALPCVTCRPSPNYRVALRPPRPRLSDWLPPEPYRAPLRLVTVERHRPHGSSRAWWVLPQPA
jgi:hypothetical protein